MSLKNQFSRFIAGRKIGIEIIVLTLSFNVLLIIVGVFPGTPINDDWAYARILEEFIRTGHFLPLDFIGMNVFTQTAMAYPFVKVLGGGWNTLHLFTMTMGTGVLILIVVWMMQQGASREIAFPIAVAWMANPIFFGLSGSFMTDVPFLALFLLSLVFATRTLQGKKSGTLVLFTLSLIAALLLRQPALWLAIAFAFACFDKKMGWKNAQFLIPIFCAVMTQALFDEWVSQAGANLEMRRYLTARVLDHVKMLLQGDQELWQWILYNSIDFPSYVAMIMIPLLPFWWLGVKRYWSGSTVKQRWGITVAFAIGCLFVALAGMPPYRSHNVIDSLGLGPFTLRDGGIIFPTPWSTDVPVIFWVGIRWLTMLTGGIILAAWAGYLLNEKAWKHPLIRMLLVFMVLYSIPFVLTDFFDRYVLPLAVCATAVLSNIAKQKTRKMVIWGWIWLVAWVAVAAIAAHDYQAWQHVRWRAGQDLLAQGIDPKRIDGGFEFNSYYLYGRVIPTPGKSGWNVVDDEYLIAFSKDPFPHYRPLSVYEVGGLLPTTPKHVLILHRNRD